MKTCHHLWFPFLSFPLGYLFTFALRNFCGLNEKWSLVGSCIWILDIQFVELVEELVTQGELMYKQQHLTFLLSCSSLSPRYKNMILFSTFTHLEFQEEQRLLPLIPTGVSDIQISEINAGLQIVAWYTECVQHSQSYTEKPGLSVKCGIFSVLVRKSWDH